MRPTALAVATNASFSVPNASGAADRIPLGCPRGRRTCPTWLRDPCGAPVKADVVHESCPFGQSDEQQQTSEPLCGSAVRRVSITECSAETTGGAGDCDQTKIRRSTRPRTSQNRTAVPITCGIDTAASASLVPTRRASHGVSRCPIRRSTRWHRPRSPPPPRRARISPALDACRHHRSARRRWARDARSDTLSWTGAAIARS
jgi:hypothetical protein